ncbi:MAG: hypothetical protein M0030_04540 [Actinomycetota bacterium]|nr:hypothetical protein [Actinomycetota bacterium]
MDEPKPGRLTETVLAAVSTAVMVWVMMPPQERYWVRLRVTQMAQDLGRRAAVRARATGFEGMGAELGGEDPTVQYADARWLSVGRDMLARAVKVMKP